MTLSYCEKIPLLPTSYKERSGLKVLDVKFLEHKEHTETQAPASGGWSSIQYKVKRSKMGNNVEAEQYV